MDVTGIHKRFGGVQALRDVSLHIAPGQVHAVLGENGAGKSTLIKVLTGVIQPDSGSITLDRPVRLHSPRAARELGITAVPQDVVLVPQLSIGRNVLLGLEGGLARKSVLSASERDLVSTALRQVGADFSASAPTASLSVPQLRLAQLARALIGTGHTVVLDEPTAALSAADADHLLSRLEALRDDGKAIVYVSHRLSEVFRLADVVTVLRNGQAVGRFERSSFDRATIVELMTKHTSPPQSSPVLESGPVLLSVDGLSSPGRFSDVSFSVAGHRILGIAGVQGSGQGQLLAAIAGQGTYSSGTVRVAGSPVPQGSVHRAYRAGMALVPADRRGAGIVGGMSIQRNLALPARADRSTRRFGFRGLRAEARLARGYVRDFGVWCRDVRQSAGTLSGGNQQKVSLARALASDPTVLLIDEPTQGVDVGAKAEIRALLRQAAGQDRCVVVAASEFEDLIGLADEILVMRAGRVVARLDGHATSYREILHHALP
ncbi:sugar ABC transporter ATP-binding protein [Kibdelosporangium philippinense]|uniref:Sugar ABC transporter ATP-binding protein n=2 Tax=Kibdelosporangium philippinense TaxID=211113 RepID=A0ABS8ZB47_9PSEU|nr:sugar ABC transporter ATP-binding protein [Kibdelosporangium philippinense]MCE7004374.1 sugar ABC transporter ATP-binding protein [Kibdelosporangium philippinense]